MFSVMFTACFAWYRDNNECHNMVMLHQELILDVYTTGYKGSRFR